MNHSSLKQPPCYFTTYYFYFVPEVHGEKGKLHVAPQDDKDLKEVSGVDKNVSTLSNQLSLNSKTTHVIK